LAVGDMLVGGEKDNRKKKKRKGGKANEFRTSAEGGEPVFPAGGKWPKRAEKDRRQPIPLLPKKKKKGRTNPVPLRHEGGNTG